MAGSAGREETVAFARLLRRHRVDLGLTQAVLAERAGVSTRGIQHLEAGLGKPHSETTQRLADALRLAGDGRANFEAAARPAPRAKQLHLQPLVATSSSPRHNLPVSVTSFLGRERELADVQERLQAARLLTLIGAGGNGKTRLALEAAKAVMGHYTDGVWFVELAPLSDASLVPNQLASVLGVREGPGEPIMTAVLRTLKERHLLLLLDNCEHLVLACAELAAALLLGCPAVHILATSREGLGIEGEALWRVPPLDQLSAERLFVERAAAASSSFSVTERNAVAIADVCARLDGTPLAIELAAARVPLLSVEQIRERLNNALGLLTTGGRLMAVRQQSLRATLDWSYGLLLETEQQLFQRLSVFAGGWALEAAEAVCSGYNIKHADVLDLLAGLVAKSLVVSERHEDEPFRYRLLEPIRQYACEKLDEPGRAESVRQQHAEFFLALAEGVQVELLGHGATAALDILEQEQDNLRGALRWLLEQSQAEGAQRLAGALYRFWLFRCHFGEGEAWLSRALALPNAVVRTAERARCLYALGNLSHAHGSGGIADAEAANREALSIWRELGNAAEEGWTLFALGHEATLRADYATARMLLKESVAVAQAAGQAQAEINAIWKLGDLAFDAGDDAEAQLRGEAMLALSTDVGWSAGVDNAHRLLGRLCLSNGEYASARLHLEAGLAVSRAIGWSIGSAQTLVCLGQLAIELGDLDRARQHLAEVLEIARALDDRTAIARGLEVFAALAARSADFGRAFRLAGSAAALRQTSPGQISPRDYTWLEKHLARARAVLGVAGVEDALRAGAALSLDRAIACAIELGDRPAVKPPPSEGVPDILTARELEVAGLVARGLTNPQIARELVIGERTVQTHVANILNKLGLSSRIQVATWVTERRWRMKDP